MSYHLKTPATLLFNTLTLFRWRHLHYCDIWLPVYLITLFLNTCIFVYVYSQYWSSSFLTAWPKLGIHIDKGHLSACQLTGEKWLCYSRDNGYYYPNCYGTNILTGFIPRMMWGSHVCISNVVPTDLLLNKKSTRDQLYLIHDNH